MKMTLALVLTLMSLSAFADEQSFREACKEEDGIIHQSGSSTGQYFVLDCEIPSYNVRGDRLVAVMMACSDHLRNVRVTEVGATYSGKPYTFVQCTLKRY